MLIAMADYRGSLDNIAITPLTHDNLIVLL